MRIHSLITAVGFTLVSVLAAGADPPPSPIVRGTIARIDGSSISIKKADGTLVTAAITPNTAFSTMERRRFEQIKPTDFVGVTSVPGPNDTLKAEEIHIIPTRGLNEGSYPWDHHPDGVQPIATSSMTNGTVAVIHDDPPATYSMTNASVTASSGMQLKVSYQGSAIVGGKCVGHAPVDPAKACTGEATVEVAPWTPIMAIVPGRSTDARVGLAVFSVAPADPQGKRAAVAVVVEKNGYKPLF